MLETHIRIPFLSQEDPSEKERATHSSVLAWEIPQTEEPGRLQSAGHNELDRTECVRVRTRAHTHTHINDGIVQQLQTPKEAPWLQDISLPSVSIQGSNTLPPRAPVSPSSQAKKEALPLHTPSLGWSVLL